MSQNPQEPSAQPPAEQNGPGESPGSNEAPPTGPADTADQSPPGAESAQPYSGSGGSWTPPTPAYPPSSSGYPSSAGSGNPTSAGSANPYGASSAQSAPDPYQQQGGWGQQPPAGEQPYGQQGYTQQPYGQPPAPQGQGYSQSYGQGQGQGYEQPQYPPGGPGSYPPGGYDPNQQYGAGQQQGYPPQPQYPGQPPALNQPPMSPSDEKLWATLAHISIPFIGFVGPLIVYLVFKDRSEWLKANSVEALNFSILYSIAQIVGSLLTVVVIGAILLPLVFVGVLILCILAAVAANKGESYRYPVNWRLIK